MPPIAGLKWRFVGPYRGGRVMAVAGHPTAPLVFYHGASSGGVWKTENGGATWRNVSDGYFRTASVGALAVAEADPAVVYAGMGECGLRSNVTFGDGVYRSTDAGATWTHLGLAETQNIARIRVHPRDPDLVYVAAFGHRFGPNDERGVYRTRDGGQTWDRLLFRNAETGAIDLSLDRHNPRVLYAALWEARIFPWKHSTLGPGSGLFKSTDGGDTWTELSANPGFPTGLTGRIGVTASPARPNRVWAIVDAPEGGIYRSDDGGAAWTWLNDDRNFLVRAWYFGQILADPLDPDAVYVVNRKLWKSVDGGRTYRQVNVPYVDEMDLWIDPRDPKRMILGNDGGAAVSFDGGDTWSTLVNQPTAEIYRVAVDTHFPYRVYGSQQDNSTLCLPSRSDRGPIAQMDWYDVGGGESGFIAVRQDDPDIVYSSDLPGLGVTRYDHRTHQIREIAPWAEPGSEEGGALRYRFNWSVPVVLSPHDPNVLYVAANRLFRTTDEGQSWDVISPDLTRNDGSKTVGLPGHHTTGEIEGSHYCTLSSIAESPQQRGVLWTGSDDGLIHLSRDDGKSWSNVTPPGLPAWSTTYVEASPHDGARAYVAAANQQLDDFRPYLFKTRDFGATWDDIADGIPANEFTRVIREDPARPGLLYVGTELGVHVSLDDGASWQPLQLNLPVVAVHDMLLKDDDLVVATHGRGLWILDDVSPLHELADGPPDGPVHLFKPRPVYRVTRHVYGLDSLLALYDNFAAPNPPSGVIVHYRLAQPAAEATISLLDSDGTVLSTLTSHRPRPTPAPIGPLSYRLGWGAAVLTGKVAGEDEPGIRWGAITLDSDPDPWRVPTEAGMHRFVLPILCPGARPIPGALHRGITAPIVPPGTYAVRLTVDGESWTQPVEVRPDPRLTTTPDEYRAQFALLLRIRDKVSQVHDAVNQIRDLRAQIEAQVRPLRGLSEFRGALDAASVILDELTAIEGALNQPGLNERSGEIDSIHFPIKLNAKLEALGYHVARSDDAPTAQSLELFDDLSRRVDEQLTKYRHVLAHDIAAFNAMMREGEVPAIVVPAE